MLIWALFWSILIQKRDTPVAPANVQMPANVQNASKCANITPANVQNTTPANVQIWKKDIDSKCANVATANVQFSVLTANVQTRDFKNNLNKLKA